MFAFTQLAAQLGYLRLSGYRLALERHGLRSKINVVNPATGGDRRDDPGAHPGRLFGGGVNASRLLATARALPPAGPPPDTQNPELMREVLLALALRDESVSGVEAAELADRALELVSGDRALDPPAALEAPRRRRGSPGPRQRPGSQRKAKEVEGASRARTGDLLHAMQALSQLSYSPDEVEVSASKGNTCPLSGRDELRHVEHVVIGRRFESADPAATAPGGRAR